MNRILFLFIATMALLTSCDDTTDTLGMSLVHSVDMVEIDAKEFYVSSKSVGAEKVVSRTPNGYIGNIKDPETNAYITCNFMTQQRPMGQYQFPPIDSLYFDKKSPDFNPELPLEQNVKALRCNLYVFFPAYYGDSLEQIKVVVHELNKPYDEEKTYYTDYDPKADGMIRYGKGSIHKELVFTPTNLLHNESERDNANYTPYFTVSLNDPYTDKDGVEYSNYGTYLMRKFYDKKTNALFNKSFTFNRDICPGFYIEVIGGLGSMVRVNATQMIVDFKHLLKDSAEVSSTSFAGTEEVLQKTTIIQDENKMKEFVNDPTCTYLKTPAGVFTELELPVEEIMAGHDDDTLNTARLFIPRINDNSTQSYKLPIPGTVLLIHNDSIDGFFKNKQVADFRMSYISSYNNTLNGYTFSNISLMVSKLYYANTGWIVKKNAYVNEKLSGNGITAANPDFAERKAAFEEEFKATNPSPFRVTLIPVETTYSTLSETSSTLTKVTYDMSLASTRLARGRKDSGIKMSVLYSRFNSK